MTDLAMRSDIVVLLAFAAVVTYLTRIGGYVILSRFQRLHPRVEAALEAVPAAVITAIVVPPAISGGVAETLAILTAGIAALRLPPLVVLLIGLVVLAVARLAIA